MMCLDSWDDDKILRILARRNHSKAAVHCAGCPIVVDGTRCRDPVKITVGTCLSPRIQGCVMRRVLRCIKEMKPNWSQSFFSDPKIPIIWIIWNIYSPCLEQILFIFGHPWCHCFFLLSMLPRTDNGPGLGFLLGKMAIPNWLVR